MRLSKVIILFGLLLAFVSSVLGQDNPAKPDRLLPARIGKFRQIDSMPGSPLLKSALFGSDAQAVEAAEYRGSNGITLTVEMIRFSQDAYAYEFLSVIASRARQDQPQLQIRPGVGTAGYVSDLETAFFKGTHFVRLTNSKNLDAATRDALVSELSDNLDKGEADIPALIKHLPNPEEAQKTAIYLHRFSKMGLALLGVPEEALSAAVESDGNADAVVGTYGSSKVVIIEFNTPQLATENDKRIIARIQELWKLGQPAPTAYRRVGNYSVFVFDAPDEQTAKQLINEVKYEQVVQWLGENPNIFKEAERRYINTTLGVLVAVLKASGYALIACLGMGALIGGLLFTYRRAQQKGVTFSDAGGMLRLNLDDLTAETNPSRLLRDRN